MAFVSMSATRHVKAISVLQRVSTRWALDAWERLINACRKSGLIICSQNRALRSLKYIHIVWYMRDGIIAGLANMCRASNTGGFSASGHDWTIFIVSRFGGKPRATGWTETRSETGYWLSNGRPGTVVWQKYRICSACSLIWWKSFPISHTLLCWLIRTLRVFNTLWQSSPQYSLNRCAAETYYSIKVRLTSVVHY